MSQPATLIADEAILVISGPDASARLGAAPVLGLACLGLLMLALVQLVHWSVPVVGLALSVALWWSISFELVFVPGRGVLRRRAGPIAWRTLDLGPRPRVVVWSTLEGDDLLIARTGEEPIEPETDGTFWVGAKNDNGLATFASHADAEIARISALPVA